MIEDPIAETISEIRSHSEVIEIAHLAETDSKVVVLAKTHSREEEARPHPLGTSHGISSQRRRL